VENFSVIIPQLLPI